MDAIKPDQALAHAKRMMDLYYAVSLKARRRAAAWREKYQRLFYEKFERGSDDELLDSGV